MLVSKREFRSADRLDSSENGGEGSCVVSWWGFRNIFGFREGQLEERLTLGPRRVVDQEGVCLK